MDKQKKILSVAAILIMLGSAAFIYQWLSPSEPSPTIPPLATETPPASTEAATEAPPPVIETTSPPEKPKVIQERFKALVAQNDDVIGWINMPNTQVDYVVAKSRNNDYYLHRDLNKKKYDPGTIFMDYRNIGDAEDRHAIIYGHNMKNGSMFGTLKRYKKQDFYNANRFFTYSTLYEDTQWEIFAAYISPATLDIIQTDFVDDADFMNFVAVRQGKSMYPIDIELKPTDKILTLVTCTYEIRDARFVIHARKVE